MALALESWSWRQDLPTTQWPEVEVKPKNFKIGKGQQSVDILVPPFCEKAMAIRADASPRVCGSRSRSAKPGGVAAKGLAGLRTDLSKWSKAKWTADDVALACWVLTYDAPFESVIEDEARREGFQSSE